MLDSQRNAGKPKPSSAAFHYKSLTQSLELGLGYSKVITNMPLETLRIIQLVLFGLVKSSIFLAQELLKGDLSGCRNPEKNTTGAHTLEVGYCPHSVTVG